MKRICYLALAAILLVGALSGCGKKEEKEEEGKKEKEEEEEELEWKKDKIK